jgi:glycosyltransferase involved in cell wall biosynthesis
MNKTRRVVVSAVNFTEGGPLTILRECLMSAVDVLPEKWEIIALVHDEFIIGDISRVRFVSFPQCKRSWFIRMYYELHGFSRRFSGTHVDLWLSLHDVTPNVSARRQVVYCHNPSPFYSVSLREGILDFRFLLFNLFYEKLYRINIRKNYAVVVQQNWLRKEFSKKFNHGKIIVAYPEDSRGAGEGDFFEGHRESRCSDRSATVILYPSLPRVFKNFEILCEAVKLMQRADAAKIELRITIDGTENNYARSLYEVYGNCESIKFIGRKNRAEMDAEYFGADVVAFPSKLETWGLPISEAKKFGKPLLVADLPYAHETVGNYRLVSFLPATDARAWATAFLKISSDCWSFSGSRQQLPGEPFVSNWPALWGLLRDGMDE